LDGAVMTVEVSVISLLLGMLVGTVLGLMRVSKSKTLSGISYGYVWIIRGTPLLVQLYLLYFGLPQVGIRLEPQVAGILGMGLNTGAYISEVVRAGIMAVDKGQMEAGLSLGMTPWLVMRRIIAPQAARVSVPPLVNQFIITLKNSSLVSLLTITELMRRGEEIIHTTFHSFEVYTVVGVIYLMLNSVLMLAAARLERGLRAGDQA
jgi:polar amino acid transport system permease protein